MITLSFLLACDPDFHKIEGPDSAADTANLDTANLDTAGPDTGDPVEDVESDWPALVVNELMAGNTDTVQDPSGGWPDWIELYNPTDAAVVLDGWTVTDTLVEPDKHPLDALTIAAGGHLLLWADGEPELGPDHLSFSLQTSGEAVGLFAPDGHAIDGLRFGQMADDISLGRAPDGGPTWALFPTASPGSSNGDAP